MKKYIMYLFFVFFLLTSLTYAADLIPQGNIDMKGIYRIKNVTNITFSDNTVLTTASGLGGDNSSWNQSLANTLYAGIEWDYNQTPLAGSNITVIGRTVAVDTVNLKTWFDTFYVLLTNVGNLNVNRSSFWDNLNSPSDITGLVDSQISDDLTANYSDLVNKPANIDEDSTNDLLIADLPLTNRVLSSILNISGTDTNACTGTDKVVNVTFSSGNLIITCAADVDTVGAGNPFNQVLNTTSNATFNNITITQDIVISGTAVKQWLYNQTTTNLSLASITGNDDNACSGTNKVINVTFNNGILSITCGTDLTAGTETDPIFSTNLTGGFSKDLTPLTNNSQDLGNSTKYWNELFVNIINLITQLTDSQISDDISANYTDLVNKPANIDEDSTNDITNSTSAGGDLSGTYPNPQVTDDSHALNLRNITGVDDNICSGTDKVINVTFNNGILNIVCAADVDTVGAGNPFNQNLNTTNNVTFVNIRSTGIINATGEIYLNNGTAVSPWLYNQTYSGSTFNATYATWAYNQTTPANSYTDTQISNNNASWSTTYNSTYNNLLNQSCPAGKIINGTLINGTFICTTPSVTETDPIFLAENASLWVEAKNKFNSTYATYAYNQTTPAISDINSRFWNRTQSYNKTEIDANNASWSTTFNSTYATYAYNQTLTNGSGISITGLQVNHTDTSSQANSDNSGNTFIQDILLDTFGHITSLVTAAVQITNIFNQDLNTTNQVTFHNITASNNLRVSGIGNFSGSLYVDNSTLVNTWLYNQTTTNLSLISITGVDHNACTGTDKITNVTFQNGALLITCAADIDTVFSNTNVAYLNNTQSWTANQTMNNGTRTNYGTSAEATIYWDSVGQRLVIKVS